MHLKKEVFYMGGKFTFLGVQSVSCFLTWNLNFFLSLCAQASLNSQTLLSFLLDFPMPCPFLLPYESYFVSLVSSAQLVPFKDDSLLIYIPAVVAVSLLKQLLLHALWYMYVHLWNCQGADFTNTFSYRIFLHWFVFMMKVTWAFSLLNLIKGLAVSGYGFTLSPPLHLLKSHITRISGFKSPRYICPRSASMH